MRPLSRAARAAAVLALAAAGCSQSSSSDHTTPPTTVYYISGTVTDGVAALPGVTVRLAGSPGTATTNASGQYRIGVTHNGTYTVAASLNGYLFTPLSIVVVVNGADVAGNDFTGAVTVAGLTISGVVTGDAAADVSVALDSVPAGVSKTTKTDSTGGFVFTGLADGLYLVTPSLAGGFTFFPRNSLVTVAGMDVAGPDFTAIAPKHAISGTVTGDVQDGVTVTLGGDADATTTTDATGAYTFTDLPDGSYTVTPSLAGYVFLPDGQPVDLAGADVSDVDFRSGIPHTIAGTITGPVVDGVKVTLSGLLSDDVKVDGTGVYQFTGLIDGDYTVTPSWDGLPLVTFGPPNAPVTLAGADQAGTDFLTVLVPTYTASGTVTGAVQAGVTVTLLDLLNPVDPPAPTTTTDAGGAWSFPGLYDGVYMVVPDLTGYLLDPASRTFNIADADVSGLDFTSSVAP